MKSILLGPLGEIIGALVVLALLALHAHGQVNNQPNFPTMPDHPAHADYHSVTSDGGTTTASGEQSSGFPTPPAPEPLGDAVKRLKLVPSYAKGEQHSVVYASTRPCQ